jgi:autotransporter-associated beta strand protein
MKTTHPSVSTLAVLCLASALVPASHAANFVWSGGSGTDLLWSTPGNWLPSGPPGPNDAVLFFDAGATNDATLINNVVSANITVQSLWAGPILGEAGLTAATHSTLIYPGVTLTIAGTAGTAEGYPLPIPNSTFFVGTKSNVSSITTVTNAFFGPGGALVISNVNNELNVRQTHPTAAAHLAVLDLWGLDTFTAQLGRIRVGDGMIDPIRRAQGFLLLARTNNITLSSAAWRRTPPRDVQLLVGNNDENNNGGGGRHSELVLGERNIFNMDEILIGARKTEGRMFFNAAATAPSLVLRGSAGGDSRIGKLRVGDHSDQANSGNQSTGNIDLSAGTVDIRADTIIVGKGQTQTGGAGNGFLTLGAGNVDVNTFEVAFQTSETANNAANGMVNLNGTTVVVNNLLRLGRSAGAAPARNANLNISAGGLVRVAGGYENQGTVNLNITDGYLSLPAGANLVASTLTVNNGAISNVNSLTVTNGLTLGTGAVITGDPAFDLGNNALGNFWEFSATPGLVATKSLAGLGTLNGAVTVSPGASLSPGGAGVGGALMFSANLTNNNAQILFDITTNAANLSDDLIAVSGHLALIGTNDVLLNNLGPTIDTNNLYTLATYGTLSGGAANLRAGGKLGNSRYTFTFDTTTQPGSILMDVNLLGAGALDLTWVGDGAANNWDFTTTNWSSGGAARFFNLDSVTFNDSGSASPAVNLAATLSPGAVTINNPTKAYAFAGPGGVDGTVLNKTGAGAATFLNNAANRFIESVVVESGSVTFSNAGLNTLGGLTVNGGSVALAGNSTNVVGSAGINVAAAAALSVQNSNVNNFGNGPVLLEGTLTFSQPVDASLLGDISGSGNLIKANTGRLTLRGNNAGLGSIVQVNAGTLRAFTATALGSSGVTVANGAALDINGQNLGALAVMISGPGRTGVGALVNNDAPNQGQAGLRNVVLTGHTTFGGVGPWFTDPVLNRGRLNIIESAIGAGDATLSSGGQPYNLTKVGDNQVCFGGVLFDDAIANIDIQQGALSFESGTTSMGNPTNTLTVRAGATLIVLGAANPLDKRLVLFGDGFAPTLFNWNGSSTLAGPVTLNGECVVDEAPPVRGTPVSLTLNGPISGTGGLTKASPRDNLILGGNNTYTGATVINGGTLSLSGSGSISATPSLTLAAGTTLDATARNDGTFTLATGQTLRGNGAVNGTFVAAVGSMISPGTSIGVLTFNNAVTLSGTVHLELNAATGTNDFIRAPAGITMNNAVISLTNLAGTLMDQQTFTLFAAPPMNGTFTIQPATPGPGQTWNTGNLLSEGWIRVVGSPAPPTPRPRIVNVALSGSNLVISGTNGTQSGSYYVLAGTNVTQPLATWERIATNPFTGGNFNFTNVVNSGTPQRYFILQLP